MNPGRLRNKIQFIGKTATVNAIGGHSVTEGAAVDAWAAIDALNGSRALQYDQLKNSQQFEITCRNNTAITTRHKVVFDGLNHSIHSIDRPYMNANMMTLIVYRSFE